MKEPISPYLITATAPIRICDNGGWTDTWFAEYGRIFNIAVSPRAEVQIEVYPNDGRRHQVTLHAENYGDWYAPKLANGVWDKQPLLEATLVRMGVPDKVALVIHIHSHVPAGAATGTSAAVTVALIGAMDCLTPGRLTPYEVAAVAQSIETDMLQQQCGIQDQLAAAYGGINDIEMFQYPHAAVSPIKLPTHTWHELQRRLCLIYLGKSHVSSQVHEKVIRHLEAAGSANKQLQALRDTAVPSRNALLNHDFAAFGRAMINNNEAQRALHPDLISADAQRIMTLAQTHGALGWKVNGAGGDGGSLTLLCGDLSYQKRALLHAIEAELPHCRHIPIQLSRDGLCVWQQPLPNDG
jgi:D-glycero-alpha-D-manno-heptose-7-phosphate kinase